MSADAVVSLFLVTGKEQQHHRGKRRVVRQMIASFFSQLTVLINIKILSRMMISAVKDRI